MAESCTGGLLSARVTSVPGASDYFDRGFVTYSNRAKTDLLDVPGELIEVHGAVSEPRGAGDGSGRPCAGGGRRLGCGGNGDSRARRGKPGEARGNGLSRVSLLG